MENITIETTLGNATFPVIKETTKVVSCGIWFNTLQVQIFTSKDDQSGYICEYNLLTHVRKLKRIKVSTIGEFPQYGRHITTKYLPIIKTNHAKKNTFTRNDAKGIF